MLPTFFFNLPPGHCNRCNCTSQAPTSPANLEISSTSIRMSSGQSGAIPRTHAPETSPVTPRRTTDLSGNSPTLPPLETTATTLPPLDTIQTPVISSPLSSNAAISSSLDINLGSPLPTSTTGAQGRDSNGRITIGLAVGIGVAVAIAIAGCSVCIYLLRKRRSIAERDKSEPQVATDDPPCRSSGHGSAAGTVRQAGQQQRVEMSGEVHRELRESTLMELADESNGHQETYWATLLRESPRSR